MPFRPANLVHTDGAALAESTTSTVGSGSEEPGKRSSAGEHPLHTGRVAGSIPAASTTPHIAALYVEAAGPYANLPWVEAWSGTDHADGATTIFRDARAYAGPHPVVAHPPCKRWGRFWHGSTRKPHQFKLGDDGGCFAAALASVRAYGGVLEHPKDSHAWEYFDLTRPPPTGGWVIADAHGGWTCCVDQGFYGHKSNKRTWLYAAGVELPSLQWGKGAQRIPEWMIERYGYAKARRIGVVAMEGGKDKVRNRNATPEPFRDLLLSIARSAYELRAAA